MSQPQIRSDQNKWAVIIHINDFLLRQTSQKWLTDVSHTSMPI